MWTVFLYQILNLFPLTNVTPAINFLITFHFLMANYTAFKFQTLNKDLIKLKFTQSKMQSKVL